MPIRPANIEGTRRIVNQAGPVVDFLGGNRTAYKQFDGTAAQLRRGWRSLTIRVGLVAGAPCSGAWRVAGRHRSQDRELPARQTESALLCASYCEPGGSARGHQFS